MGEVVNLRMARKARARAAGESKAAENRIRFGRKKQERMQDEAERRAREAHLDARSLGPDADSE